jgi:glycosyltransferase involved in cell wall biosynthesis
MTELSDDAGQDAAEQDAATNVALSIVLPAYNEVGLLGSTVTNLITGLDDRGFDYEIVIVENGSTDGTLRLARMLAAQLAPVRLLTLPIPNYGEALLAGFAGARGGTVVNFDVDYYDLAFLDEARRLIEDGDAALVLASKRAPGSSDRRPISRRLLTFGFTTLLHMAVALPVSDAHGMKACDRAALAPIVARCRLRGSIYDVEVVCRAAQAGLAIRELPATVVERRPPRTSLSSRSFEALLDIARLRFILARERIAVGRTHSSDPAPLARGDRP